MNQLNKIEEKWIQEGIKAISMAKEEDIRVFESNNILRLPEDMKEYFKKINGTNDQYDDGFVQFYSLFEIKKVNEAYSDWQGVPDYKKIVYTLDEYKKYYVFADYMIHTFCYAIYLDSGNTKNDVLVICGGDYKRIADSFSEFLDLYIGDSDKLQI
jgi:hypothetical protein